MDLMPSDTILRNLGVQAVDGSMPDMW